jgi:hypothetical protein
VTLACMIALWFLPVIIAFGRGAYPRRQVAIGIICLLLSWTIVGWVFALIWAVDSPARGAA